MLENRYRLGLAVFGYSVELVAVRVLFTAGGAVTFEVPLLLDLLAGYGDFLRDAAIAGQVSTCPSWVRCVALDRCRRVLVHSPLRACRRLPTAGWKALTMQSRTRTTATARHLSCE